MSKRFLNVTNVKYNRHSRSLKSRRAAILLFSAMSTEYVLDLLFTELWEHNFRLQNKVHRIKKKNYDDLDPGVLLLDPHHILRPWSKSPIRLTLKPWLICIIMSHSLFAPWKSSYRNKHFTIAFFPPTTWLESHKNKSKP